MRGRVDGQGAMFFSFSPDALVPETHPLRAVKRLADGVLGRLQPRFASAYAATGRPSIPPEQLLKALLLQACYSIRSERQLCEQIGYNLLFGRLVDLSPEAPVWDPTTFTKNRERFAAHGLVLDIRIAAATGQREREQARAICGRVRRRHGLRPRTLGADKGYDAGRLLHTLEARLGIVPHVATRDGPMRARDRSRGRPVEADERSAARGGSARARRAVLQRPAKRPSWTRSSARIRSPATSSSSTTAAETS